MLVLTRREGEEVTIGDPANPLGRVRIASIRGDRVRIAFDFPAAIQIHRSEVAAEIIEKGSRKPVGCGESSGGKPVDAVSVGVGSAPLPPPMRLNRQTGAQPTAQPTSNRQHVHTIDRDRNPFVSRTIRATDRISPQNALLCTTTTRYLSLQMEEKSLRASTQEIDDEDTT